MGHTAGYKPSEKARAWADEVYLMAVRSNAGAEEVRKCRNINAAYLQSIIPNLQPATQLYAAATIENLLS